MKKMRSLNVFCLTLFFCFIASVNTLKAEQPLPCVSFDGVAVQYNSSPSLNNVGVATWYNGSPVILINENILNQFSPLVQQWWFAHECGHHAVDPSINSEIEADCFATRALKKLGFISTTSDVRLGHVDKLDSQIS